MVERMIPLKTNNDGLLFYMLAVIMNRGSCPNCENNVKLGVGHEDGCHFKKVDEEIERIVKNRLVWE